MEVESKWKVVGGLNEGKMAGRNLWRYFGD